jgi:hypothetical protein
MTLFETLVGQPTVELATIGVLRAWLPIYLAEVERQHSLTAQTLTRPPVPESYVGGLDFLGWQEDRCPTVIVVANPVGEPERTASAGYSQAFEVQVSAVVIGDSEDEARALAGHYGTAIQGAIVQQGSLGGLAQRTVMTAAPRVEFQDPDQRRLAVAAATFHTFVDPIVSEDAGPDTTTPPDSPHYGGSPDAPFTDWPTVQTPHVSVTAQPTEQ